ncbi:tumor protein p53-inducible nuclear protein 2-like [Oncorhynchus kisutch]|uniref:Si:ch211-260e23.9 n=1 Tax=Oncorhynchus kisutch TaxID=8019 RepID=A0A8C7F8U3_ONCKI|nr:tumor protein p53-inducible nuclear protein 2-like [Oncorhynchus kisutch]XP_031686610.1 tumor protein p53-inducible nuclear protein 2-like [Oncorhynchus kisutch]
MIGKILAHFLGSTDDDFSTDDNETYEELIEFEAGGWVVINIQENNSLTPPEEDPLENLLIEHPSMSVDQIRHQLSDEEDTSPRPVPVKQHVSWRLAARGSPLPCNIQLLAIQRARTHLECKKLTRSALQRQSCAKVRFSHSDRRFGHFKQPCQRLYNY